MIKIITKAKRISARFQSWAHQLVVKVSLVTYRSQFGSKSSIGPVTYLPAVQCGGWWRDRSVEWCDLTHVSPNLEESQRLTREKINYVIYTCLKLVWMEAKRLLSHQGEHKLLKCWWLSRRNIIVGARLYWAVYINIHIIEGFRVSRNHLYADWCNLWF